MKTLKKLTMLFFVAATIMTTMSCKKETGIEENQLYGKWKLPSDVEYAEFQNSLMEIKSDHTVIMHVRDWEITYSWTLSDDRFFATRDVNGVKADIEFTIAEINTKTMKIDGTYVVKSSITQSYNISGIMTKM